METKAKIIEALEEKRVEIIWELIEKAIDEVFKENFKIPKETKEEYLEYEYEINDKKTRYIIVEHYNIEDGFYCRFYNEAEGRHFGDMLKDYFSDSGGSQGEIILLVDMKEMKCYLLEEEVKYHKQEIKIK